MGCYALLQWIFVTQGLNLSLPHCRPILYHLSHQGSTEVCSKYLLNADRFHSFSHQIFMMYLHWEPDIMLDSCEMELNQRDKISNFIEFKIKRGNNLTSVCFILVNFNKFHRNLWNFPMPTVLKWNNWAEQPGIWNYLVSSPSFMAFGIIICDFLKLIIAHVCVYSQCPSLSRNFVAVCIYWESSLRY